MTTVLKHVATVVPITVKTSQITLRNIAVNICGLAKEFHGSVRDAKRLATHVKALQQFYLVTAMLFTLGVRIRVLIRLLILGPSSS